MSGGARVPIPNNVRKTIEDIREITGKQHTDEEIYAVLRECSMDPNETIQKLLYLDTFHEVRRRRDRKKEVFSSSRVSEDSRPKHGGQGRGGRGASGGHLSNFSDGGGGRNHAIHRENGVNHSAERSQKPKANTASQATRVPAIANHGTTNLSNGKSGHSSNGQSFTGSAPSVPKSSAAVNGTSNKKNVQPEVASVAAAAASSPSQTFDSFTSIGVGKSLSSAVQLQNSAAAAASGVYSSSLDPVLAPSFSSNPGVTGAISREVGNHLISAGANHVKANQVAVHDVDDLPAHKNENSVSVPSTTTMNAQYKPNEVENNRLSDPSRPSSSSSLNGSLRPSSSSGSQPPPANVIEVSTSEVCVQSSSEPKQHVTFPNHFQVHEALKSGLTFGSFDTLGSTEGSSSGTDGDNNISSHDSSLGNDKDVISRDQGVSLTAQGDHVDFQHSSSYMIEKTPALEGNSLTSSDSKDAHPKQEVFLAPESHSNPIMNVQSAQNYGLNFMSMLGTQQVQYEGIEPQSQETSRFNNFVSANSQAVSSPSPTPPLQSSIGPVPPQSVSIFRPPYPANFFPYGPYYPPIYVSPIHQFLSHNGFPQQPSAGNMYLPAAPAAAGIKFPLPQFKAGANTGNTAHLGIPSGSFISHPVGYAPSPTVNTGSSAGNEDLSVPQLKENQIYTTGQQSEGSGVWLPAPGQDISSLQVNSLYNLTPQGHLPFPPPQVGHGAYPGIYSPGQSVVPPSTLLQQSQAVAGPVETVGPPSGSYHHQPQPAQINWNSNF